MDNLEKAPLKEGPPAPIMGCSEGEEDISSRRLAASRWNGTFPPPNLGGPGGPLCVLLQQEPDAVDLPLPSYATNGAAGMDLRAAITDSVTLLPGARVLVSTGVRIALPGGYEAQVRPRSGLALQHGVTLLNSPGTIDSDYRGIIGVILINLGQEPFTITRGDRIAQMIVAPVAHVRWETTDSLPETVRRDGGFGHTGVNNGVGP